jgi:hypothetical protein
MDFDLRKSPAISSAVMSATLLFITCGACGDATDGPQAKARAPSAEIVSISAQTGAALQEALNKHAAKGGRVRIDPPSTITCPVREDKVAGETSRHALLVPAGIQLDLNGGTLLLDLRSVSYGIRLSNDSAIRNGTVKVVRSEGVQDGSQAIWHAPIGVGAAYGDGGTVARPGYFSKVSNWRIEDLTIDQPFAHSVIQLMSEAQNGVIRNLTILDSPKALIGIGMGWGSLGPITTADEKVSAMRKLWEKGEILSTHPHDILIENIEIGVMGRDVDGNDAGVRCSACHNITIRNIHIKEAAAAIAIFGGDFGYEVAPDDQRPLTHAGYVIDGVKIDRARKYGLVFNGQADNIYRAHVKYGYDVINDPSHPGLNKPVIRNVVVRGVGNPSSYGMYVAAVTDATFDNVDIEGFDQGVRVKDWVRGLRFANGRIAKNRKDVEIVGATEKPVNVVFQKVAEQ